MPRPTPTLRLTPRLLVPTLLLTLIAGLAAAPRARAAGCSGCPAPAIADLQAHPDFRLEWRGGGTGGPSADYVEMDAGECIGRLEGEPEIVIGAAWLVLRGQGEVWNCPHSKSVDTITIESAAADRSEWSLKAKLGAELGVLGAKVKLEVEAGRTKGTTVTEVTRVSKQITPAYCHRIAWKGHFEVVLLHALCRYRFERRWAWWTKNVTTGDAVHAKGDVWVDCGGGEIELERRAPVSGHFDLAQRGCDAPECRSVLPRRLGMFPPFVPPGAGGGTQPQARGEPGAEPVPSDEDPRTDGPSTPATPSTAPTTSGELPAPPSPEDTGESAEPRTREGSDGGR